MIDTGKYRVYWKTRQTASNRQTTKNRHDSLIHQTSKPEEKHEKKRSVALSAC